MKEEGKGKIDEQRRGTELNPIQKRIVSSSIKTIFDKKTAWGLFPQ